MMTQVMAHELHSYTAGAYATAPQLDSGDDGRGCARGEIQQWRGALADVCAAAEVIMEGEGERSARISVALNSATAECYESLRAFCDAAELLDPDDVAAVRVDGRVPDEGQALILVRRQRPGIIVEAGGRDRTNVLGLAQLLHGRLMAGYVDIGGLRWLLTPGKSKGVVLLSSRARQEMPLQEMSPVETPRAEVTVSETAEGRSRRPWGRVVRTRVRELYEWPRVRVRRLFERRWMRRLLSSLGVVALGVLTTKVAEWL